MLSRHADEPLCDILAQINALLDKDHPKTAVFLSCGNGIPFIPRGAIVLSRSCGTLFTTDKEKAIAFQNPNLDDAEMAHILGYPETKAEVEIAGNAVVVQALDGNGSVITEAATSEYKLAGTVRVLTEHVPVGGQLNVTTLDAALARRRDLIRRETQKGSYNGLV